jgi:uncharacterized protein YcbK (DUF882 family)
MTTKSKSSKPTKVSKRQQEILAFFQSRKFTEKELSDIQNMLSDYYAENAQTSIDEFVDQKGWTQKDLDRMANAHIRTAAAAASYKK